MSLESRPINEIRYEVVTEAFTEAIGSRALIMIAEFPFLVIGQIEKVVGDFVFICVETTHISELEGRVMRIHLDDVVVFYIENDGPRIPKINS
ncbi:hypothetical protein AJ85_18230 [Alkalihalobacillus alcalophilus ATCC 27647 = CGMCC 1.3604]|uniref:DUF2642 domain-containing protein n=1 Tax=Alkalihalobacillus alcalophilus ATCC 27647 = CGMCC 1.3604 TaxID=1218173 RepID=A0A094XCR3_ALKAL|nr:hypothetical protein [Alkalihalobacillus alcalophilus]KGA96590.1 hypothetical protein BALCAV_0215300 [Alkalihalobacillus alcalophilus ATCC 27647 = CGMCC 1.3604]MED1563775.1 hypothetical protein [Alkalihalobacillus alcalophilus]THG89345.1 hypothetical protein AJ85_18230 [Alkalihalobacillus alcalophilus ATCC 27647 = CGMCC 1.3604]